MARVEEEGRRRMHLMTLRGAAAAETDFFALLLERFRSAVAHFRAQSRPLSPAVLSVNLSRLGVDGERWREAVCPLLRSLGSLEGRLSVHLDLSGNFLHDDDLNRLFGVANGGSPVVQLSLASNFVGRVAECLGGIRDQLRVLSLAYNPLVADALGDAVRWPRLETLNLTGTRGMGESSVEAGVCGVRLVSLRFPRLRRLCGSLSADASVQGAFLDALTRGNGVVSPTLEELVLLGVRWVARPLVFEPLGYLDRLRCLDLTGATFFEDDDEQVIRSLGVLLQRTASLETLILDECDLNASLLGVLVRVGLMANFSVRRVSLADCMQLDYAVATTLSDWHLCRSLSCVALGEHGVLERAGPGLPLLHKPAS